MMMPTLSINLSNLKHNLKRVRDCAPHSKVLAMVKANAYGHGLIDVAKALVGADALGVARLEEAEVLRANGIETPITIMGGVCSELEWQTASELNCAVVVHQLLQLEQLEQLSLSKPVSIWIKLNTGMNRLGLPCDQFAEIYQRLQQLDYVVKPLVVLTHFSDAEVLASERTEAQLNALRAACAETGVLLSAANSAAILSGKAVGIDWVRPGLMLYGVSPFPGETAAEFSLKPVMTLTTRLIAVNHCQLGEGVGYNRTWQCPEAMPVGVAAIGYGDGFPRHIPVQGVRVLVNGKPGQIIGRVSMDLITIDLRACPDAKIGDEVELWGEHLPIEALSQVANSSPYELLVHINSREVGCKSG